MKINDVLTEAEYYGFDDIKTAASSFLKNLWQGTGVKDAQQYAMRDRAVRMIAKGFQDQWKNIVYDLRRVYEKDIKADPAKGAQNRSTITSRLTKLVKDDIGISTNNKVIADATAAILDATIDQTGQFKPQGSLNGTNVLNAFNKLTANAVTNIAYQMQKAQTGVDPAQNQDDSNSPAQVKGNTYKTKDPNDYGKKLPAPLDKMFDRYGDRHWYDDAIIPVQVVTEFEGFEYEQPRHTMYVKFNGVWYVDSSKAAGEIRFEKDETAAAESTRSDALSQTMLERIIAFHNTGQLYPNQFVHQVDPGSKHWNVIGWAGPWGIRRVEDSPNRYLVLNANDYEIWAKNTGRNVVASESPADSWYETQLEVESYIEDNLEDLLDEN